MDNEDKLPSSPKSPNLLLRCITRVPSPLKPWLRHPDCKERRGAAAAIGYGRIKRSLGSTKELDQVHPYHKQNLPHEERFSTFHLYEFFFPFCSVECRCRQIFMDEESGRRDNCSLDAELQAERGRPRVAARKGRATAGGFAY
ncbi:hypothetical protein B296_00045185 [Ensete ventricosum]|uniref:FLZ-type domain-containing protein n=1 Tax=Ensete ventricosum TaxID=4639 RepID=A0A426YDC7_ENSVE|nr:hypothetical protein B296_00045185 [Ensete ventricosum]